MSAGRINPWDIRDQNMYMLKQLDISFPASWPEKENKLNFKESLSNEGEYLIILALRHPRTFLGERTRYL